MEPEQFVREFDETWNSHDADAALAYFTDDAIVTLSPPPPPPLRESYAGRDEIGEFVDAVIPGFHVTSKNIAQAGEYVTWEWSATADGFRAMGLDPAIGTGRLLVDGDRVKEFHVTITNAPEPPTAA